MKTLLRSGGLYGVLQTCRKIGGRAWMGTCRKLFGIRRKRVFFSSFRGKSYSDSPRCISENLHRLRPDLQIVWQLSRHAYDGDVPVYVKTISPRTPKTLYYIATSRCIVDNFNRPMYMRKYDGQLYVQTWHGDRGFKKMQLDMNPSADYPDGRQMDLGVSGSDFGTKLYRSAFGYSGEVLQVGMPRNDCLLHPDHAKMRRTRERLNIPEGARILTYAPTFRDDAIGAAQSAPFDIEHALHVLSQKNHENWVCLVRSHDLGGKIETSANVIDATYYPEMAEILAVTDILVTDLSSSAGDFLLTGRRIVLYQPPADHRALYMRLEDTGYRMAHTPEQLEQFLTDDDDDALRNQSVLAFYGATESGNASRAVAEWIAQRIS